MTQQTPRVLSDFEGRWRLARRIVPAEGPPAEFDGQAEWRRDPAGLLYRETGWMVLEGHTPMQAERRYLWTEDLAVFFDDGRFFHRVPAQGGAAHHQCAPDDYTLVYDFAMWPAFRVLWRVTGPRKDYRAESLYTRA